MNKKNSLLVVSSAIGLFFVSTAAAQNPYMYLRSMAYPPAAMQMQMQFVRAQQQRMMQLHQQSSKSGQQPSGQTRGMKPSKPPTKKLSGPEQYAKSLLLREQAREAYLKNKLLKAEIYYAKRELWRSQRDKKAAIARLR